MLQIYVLTELFLVLSSFYLLSERLGARFLLLINLRNTINSNKKIKYGIIIAGLCITLGLCLLPMDPGPMVIGDFLPELNILILLLYFSRCFFSSHSVESFVNKKRDTLGYVTLCIALIHFLFPQIVLI